MDGWERRGEGPYSTPSARLADRDQCGGRPQASDFRAVSGASKAVTSGQVPGAAAGTHFSAERLTLRGGLVNRCDCHWAPHLPPDEASAADGAHGLPRGTGHTRGPPGEALPSRCLLGCALGGPGGIGPDGDVIPAPLEGESHITGL